MIGEFEIISSSFLKYHILFLISAFFPGLIAFVFEMIIEIYRNVCYNLIIKLKEIMMFKEKRNKGFISGLILSLVFFAFSAGTVFMWNHHQHPMDPFSDDTRSGKEVTMTVYDIYPEVVGEVEGGSVLYLVQYSNDGDGKFAVVEAKENDKEIQKLMEQAATETLIDNPATLVGTQLQPLSKMLTTNLEIIEL